MDIKINNLEPMAPAPEVNKPVETDSSFKFVLASNIHESELQEKLRVKSLKRKKIFAI